MSENVEAALPSSEVAPVPAAEPVQDDSESPELQMRRRAAAVLEVLGGAKSPFEAAEVLGIALPSYYLLEARALEGLVSACEPKRRGRAVAGKGRRVVAERECFQVDLLGGPAAVRGESLSPR